MINELIEIYLYLPLFCFTKQAHSMGKDSTAFILAYLPPSALRGVYLGDVWMYVGVFYVVRVLSVFSSGSLAFATTEQMIHIWVISSWTQSPRITNQLNKSESIIQNTRKRGNI